MVKKKIGLTKKLLANYLSNKAGQIKSESISYIMKTFLKEIKSIIKIYIIARVVSAIALIVIMLALVIFLIRHF